MSLRDRDINGIKYKFPNKTCKDCRLYPCMEFANLKCDFAKYGCKSYK